MTKEPKPVQAPAWLDEDARALWAELIEPVPAEAIRDGHTLLAMACAELAEYRRWAQHARSLPFTAKGISAVDARVHRTALMHLDAFMVLSRRLGLSPLDRLRLGHKTDQPDGLAELLARKPQPRISGPDARLH